MRTPEFSDPLDALLREQDGYTEDGGFTARVMASLPPRRRSWLRPAILLGTTVAGFALLAWLLPQITHISFAKSAGGISFDLKQTILAIGATLLVGASLGWCLVAAVKWED